MIQDNSEKKKKVNLWVKPKQILREWNTNNDG